MKIQVSYESEMKINFKGKYVHTIFLSLEKNNKLGFDKYFLNTV